MITPSCKGGWKNNSLDGLVPVIHLPWGWAHCRPYRIGVLLEKGKSGFDQIGHSNGSVPTPATRSIRRRLSGCTDICLNLPFIMPY